MGADDFALKVPLNQALFGFGDAVCVPVIKWIADHYLTPLARDLHAEAERKPAPAGSRSIKYGKPAKRS
jgi:DNA (cytosine-5)-methyltransferase 1